MKVSQLVLIVALTIALPHGVTAFSQSARVATQDLLSMPIDNLKLEAANIHLLLSELSTQSEFRSVWKFLPMTICHIQKLYD